MSFDSFCLPQNVDRQDIGQFPYNRGETPIFNFDIGDEPFLQVCIAVSFNSKSVYYLHLSNLRFVGFNFNYSKFSDHTRSCDWIA